MMSILRHNWGVLSLGAVLSLSGAFYLNGSSKITGWFMETTRNAGFVLSNLQIIGLARTSQNAVLATLDVDDGMPLLAIDLMSIQGRIEALPWVKSATVTRVLPSDLMIKITERQPYALWQQNGKVRLIDEDGVIITSRGLTEFSHLMLIVGEGADGEVAGLFKMLRADPALLSRIKTAVRVGDRRWDLVFDNGVRVKLPEDFAQDQDDSDAWARFVRLQQKHKLLEREVSVIDMRIKDRVVMRVTPAGHRLMDGKEWAT